MPLYIAQRGYLVRCYRCLTHSQTLKDSATQLLIKYKSGALVTHLFFTLYNTPMAVLSLVLTPCLEDMWALCASLVSKTLLVSG